jgi:hypothetical protein
VSSQRIKVYNLFPSWRGLSAMTADYHGETIKVAAASIRQAYYLAGRMVWSGGPDQPLGVLEHYTRDGPDEGWHLLWCGCRIHGGIGLKHGAGKRAIVAAMQTHLAERHRDGGAR